MTSRRGFLGQLAALLGIVAAGRIGGVSTQTEPYNAPAPELTGSPDVVPPYDVTLTSSASGSTYRWNVNGPDGGVRQWWFRATEHGTEWLNPETNSWESVNEPRRLRHDVTNREAGE